MAGNAEQRKMRITWDKDWMCTRDSTVHCWHLKATLILIWQYANVVLYFVREGLEFSSEGSISSAQSLCSCDNFGTVMSLLWNGWCLLSGREKHPHIKVQILLGQCPVFYSVVSSLPSQRARLSSFWWRHTQAHHRWPSLSGDLGFPCHWFYLEVKRKVWLGKSLFSMPTFSACWLEHLRLDLLAYSFEDVFKKSVLLWHISSEWPLIKWFCRCRPECGASRNLQFNQLWGFIWAKCSESLEGFCGLSPFCWFPWQFSRRTRWTLDAEKSLPPRRIKAAALKRVKGVSLHQQICMIVTL